MGKSICQTIHLLVNFGRWTRHASRELQVKPHCLENQIFLRIRTVTRFGCWLHWNSDEMSRCVMMTKFRDNIQMVLYYIYPILQYFHVFRFNRNGESFNIVTLVRISPELFLDVRCFFGFTPNASRLNFVVLSGFELLFFYVKFHMFGVQP